MSNRLFFPFVFCIFMTCVTLVYAAKGGDVPVEEKSVSSSTFYELLTEYAKKNNGSRNGSFLYCINNAKQFLTELGYKGYSPAWTKTSPNGKIKLFALYNESNNQYAYGLIAYDDSACFSQFGELK